jgi:hypothetical protein
MGFVTSLVAKAHVKNVWCETFQSTSSHLTRFPQKKLRREDAPNNIWKIKWYHCFEEHAVSKQV